MQEQEVTLQDLYRSLRQKIHESGLLGEADAALANTKTASFSSSRFKGKAKCPPGQGKFGGVCHPKTPEGTMAPKGK